MDEGNQMVERVARAIALADLDHEVRRTVNLDAHMMHVREHYSEIARAAIEATNIDNLQDALLRIIDIAEGDGTSRAQPRIADIARRAVGVPL
jgi:hypothetical protein